MMHGTMRVLGLTALCAILVACPGGGGTPTITLAGDVSCPVPPPNVTGTATLNAAQTGLTATANVTCNGIPIQGVVLTAEIRHPAGTLPYTFPATDAAGNTSLTATFPVNVGVTPGSQFRIRVLDGSGNPVAPPDPVVVTVN